MRALPLALAFGVLLAGCVTTKAPEDTGSTGTEPSSCVPATNGTRGANDPLWILDTSQGCIRMRLFLTATPVTAWNFVNLTESKYFDGQRFHRVIRDFMNQGGDPLTKDETQAARWGTGGPGYTIPDEFPCADGSTSYAHPARCGQLRFKHDKPGVLSMANTGAPRTGGSQFFLTAVPTAWLDGKHAIFGESADKASTDVITKINRVPTTSSDRPVTPVVIAKASIEWP